MIDEAPVEAELYVLKIDYKALSEENLKRYGTDIGDWAPELLANLYHERTHFVFELLQNAEDALRKRSGPGSRSVRFDLSQEGLMVAHHGKSFDEPDVRGICGINKSTKKDELTAIGRFGIGFKSVYAVTDRPEIRSAGQHFAIESYVHPVELAPSSGKVGETTFWFPFKPDDASVFDEIAEGLRNLDARTLLFLRHVEEIDWRIEGGAEGSYCRETKEIQPGLRRVTLIGMTESSTDLTEEEWLVFSRPAESMGKQVGFVEIAYSIDSSALPDKLRLRNVIDSRLAAFFSTSVRTGLGTRLQAPYKTTPARDNVPPKDPWNQHLIKETASLLVESVKTLKSLNALSVDVFCGLPIDPDDFDEESMFRPLYVEVAEALRVHELLPTNGSIWLRSSRAALARGQELRDLVNSTQLSMLFSSVEPLEWLSDDITLDRTPDLRSYLMNEHDIREIQPQTFLMRVTKEFLEAQSDEWIRKLYGFLLGQSYLMKTAAIANKPWVRLENGTHVVAFTGEQPNAFLPSKSASGFPTVRLEVSKSDEALEFLKNNLKLTEPDPVDDVIANILPCYNGDDNQHFDIELYREHLKAIEAAYGTQLRNQREKLVAALKDKRWVPSIDNEGNKDWLTPFDCYLPTDRLKQLFEGVSGVNFVDDSVPGLPGEAMRNILIACGSARYLDTVKPKAGLTADARFELRRQWGDSNYTRDEPEDDQTLHGLDGILARIAELPFEEASARCVLLWEALADVVQDKREGVVKATYSWFYYSTRSIEHDAAFIRTLKSSAWIPTPDRRLTMPSEVVFEHINPVWPPNAVLQSVLNFRPSVVDQLAKAMGLEPGVLSFLKKNGITSEAELKQRLGIATDEDAHDDEEHQDNDQQNDDGLDYGHDGSGAGGGDSPGNGKRKDGEGRGSSGGDGHTNSGGSNQSSGGGSTETDKSAHTGRREFVSYLATNPIAEEDEDISDSESHAELMRVEAIAIDHILTLEPELHKTPPGNVGFDLYGTDNEGHHNRWIEVKSMVGVLANHPVGMSKRQFETAQEKQTRFWLYIVENATSEEPRILKIQDPAGNARTFTFDQGWSEIAMVSQINVATGEVKV